MEEYSIVTLHSNYYCNTLTGWYCSLGQFLNIHDHDDSFQEPSVGEQDRAPITARHVRSKTLVDDLYAMKPVASTDTTFLIGCWCSIFNCDDLMFDGRLRDQARTENCRVLQEDDSEKHIKKAHSCDERANSGLGITSCVCLLG